MSKFRFALYTWIQPLCLPLLAASCAHDTRPVTPAHAPSAKIEKVHAHPARKIPADLVVPRGNQLAFQFQAKGVQIYTCQDGGDGQFNWVFTAPEAKLLDDREREAGTHYAGPTWQVLDGSQVACTNLASVSVDESAIPWLLLQASTHTGAGLMSRITYVQRLDTVGGLAPATPCDEAHSGETSRAPYTANYAFFLPEAQL